MLQQHHLAFQQGIFDFIYIINIHAVVGSRHHHDGIVVFPYCDQSKTGGSLIHDPRAVGLDFILPVYFLVLVSDFRKRANFLPVAAISALTAGILYATVGAPWHVTFGGLAGIAYAAAVKPAKQAEGEA